MKEKREQKSKAQIAADMKKVEMVKEQRVMVKDVIYPYLLTNSKSIEDAKLFMSTVGVAVKQAFMNKMMEIKVGDLKLIDSLDPKGPSYDKYKGFFELINDKTVTEASILVEGMPQEIDMLVRQENEKRPLSDLKTNFL